MAKQKQRAFFLLERPDYSSIYSPCSVLLLSRKGGFYFLPLFTLTLYNLPSFTLTSIICHSLLCNYIICPLAGRAHIHLPKYPAFLFDVNRTRALYLLPVRCEQQSTSTRLQQRKSTAAYHHGGGRSSQRFAVRF
jgi:hypothetical protein